MKKTIAATIFAALSAIAAVLLLQKEEGKTSRSESTDVRVQGQPSQTARAQTPPSAPVAAQHATPPSVPAPATTNRVRLATNQEMSDSRRHAVERTHEYLEKAGLTEDEKTVAMGILFDGQENYAAALKVLRDESRELFDRLQRIKDVNPGLAKVLIKRPEGSLRPSDVLFLIQEEMNARLREALPSEKAEELSNWTDLFLMYSAVKPLELATL